MTRTLRRLFFAPAVQIIFASLAGLGLRLYLLLRFPVDAGDSSLYEELAANWLDAHIYGVNYGNGIVPSDVRSPGYPAFVALLYLFVRRSRTVILLAEAVIDIATCLLVAWLVYQLVAEPYRRRVGLAALWLATTCPFIANYAAVPLAEVLATFLTAAALIPLATGCAAFGSSQDRSLRDHDGALWFLGGLLVGMGTLVRPEAPLILATLALVLGVRWRAPAEWRKLLRVGALTAAGLLLPLLPWGARNWVRFHEVQLLAPRYAASPDEYTPRGLYAWTGTWLVRFRDVYVVPWNVGSDTVPVQDVPDSAFDTPEERVRVTALFDRYNATRRMTPEVDAGFADLARERTARHPLRTYLFVPAERIVTLWFTPRVELLPISGHLRPVREQWNEDPTGFAVTLLFGALNIFYVALALEGLRRAVRQPGIAGHRLHAAVVFLIVFIVLRTAFLTQVETPEPRYVLECFPALLALGSFGWLPREASVPQAVRDGS